MEAEYDPHTMRGATMATHFDPRKVLRQISVPLLEQFFTGRGDLLDLPWDKLKDTHQVDAVFDAWQQLPDDRRGQIQSVLRNLLEAADERGMRAFAEALRTHDPDNTWKLTACNTRLNKAMWFYLNYPQLYDQATLFARADGLSTGRYAVRRNSLPKRPIRVTQASTQALATELSKYYWPNQMRGQHCQVEHYTRSGGNEYFFAYLDNWPDTFLRFDDDGTLDHRTDRQAFSVLFVMNPQNGTLELVAKGGRDVQNPLQQAFCRSVLGLEVEPIEPLHSAYTLQRILDPDFTYPTDPADGIARVRLVNIHWVPSYRLQGKYFETGFSEDEARQQWLQTIHSHLQAEGHTPSSVTVKNAVFELTLMTNGVTAPETIEFSITVPRWCNLNHLSDEHREIVERCLRLWELINE
jgi:hypothetical protein